MAKTVKTQHQKRYQRLLGELKRARLEAGVTQSQVSGFFGKHAPYLSKIESGERRLDVLELVDLCNYYQVSLIRLLRRAGLAE